MQTVSLVMPLVLCILVTGSIAIFTYLFLELKREVRRQTLGARSQRTEMDDLRKRLTSDLATLQSALTEATQRAEYVVQPSPPRPGLNSNKRSQALRMYRRGDRPEQIATVLSLPQKEVALLVKVYNLAASA